MNQFQRQKSSALQHNVSNFSLYGGQALWFPVLALLSFGILFVYSASSVYAGQKFGNEFIFVNKQLMYILPAIVAGITGMLLPIKLLDRYIGRIFVSSLLLTMMTHAPIIGKKIKGSARWLALGPVQFQPSEFLKISAVLMASYLLSKKPQDTSPQVLTQLWPLLLCFAVLLQQPDFGSTVILFVGVLSIVFIHGIKKKFFAISLALLLPCIFLLMIAAPYRVQRLVTFLDPFADPKGKGFQVIQSFLAIANGGWFGVGLGGSQQKLFFLPEAHTDFILAVIAEEMGFAGVLIIAFIYFLLFYACAQIVTYAANHRHRLLATGIFTMLAGTAIINMGVVAGLLPTKGLPLPFVSAGGSALIANFFILGLLAQIHKEGFLALRDGRTCS